MKEAEIFKGCRGHTRLHNGLREPEDRLLEFALGVEGLSGLALAIFGSVTALKQALTKGYVQLFMGLARVTNNVGPAGSKTFDEAPRPTSVQTTVFLL